MNEAFQGSAGFQRMTLEECKAQGMLDEAMNSGQTIVVVPCMHKSSGALCDNALAFLRKMDGGISARVPVRISELNSLFGGKWNYAGGVYICDSCLRN